MGYNWFSGDRASLSKIVDEGLVAMSEAVEGSIAKNTRDLELSDKHLISELFSINASPKYIYYAGTSSLDCNWDGLTDNEGYMKYIILKKWGV